MASRLPEHHIADVIVIMIVGLGASDSGLKSPVVLPTVGNHAPNIRGRCRSPLGVTAERWLTAVRTQVRLRPRGALACCSSPERNGSKRPVRPCSSRARFAASCSFASSAVTVPAILVPVRGGGLDAIE
jgi:hypothetical protein